MTTPIDDNTARNRWLTIQAVRVVSVGLTVVGIMTLTDELDLPRTIGWVALLLGLAGALIIPSALVRRWRSPRP